MQKDINGMAIIFPKTPHILNLLKVAIDTGAVATVATSVVTKDPTIYINIYLKNLLFIFIKLVKFDLYLV